MSPGEPSSELVSFSGELFRLRIIRGLTQADVANDAGLNRGYYSQLENARRSAPPPSTLERIAVALQLDGIEKQKLFDSAGIEWARPRRNHHQIANASEKLAHIQRVLGISPEQLRRIQAILEEK